MRFDFQRSISLPAGVDADKIDANFKEGVLKIRLPKTDISSAKIININEVK